MHFFHISIVWGAHQKPIDQLSPIFDLAEDWMAISPGLYIIYTAENVFVWQGRITAIMGPYDNFLISQISNIYETGGWTSSKFWEWLRKQRGQSIEDTQGPWLTAGQ